MTSKHDRITNSLEELVRDAPISGKNVEYGDDTHVYGEIDFFMYRQGHLWLFEVKSNPSNIHLYNKAVKQMDRAMKPNKFIGAFEDMYDVPVNVAHGFYVTNTYIPVELRKRHRNLISPVLKHLETRFYD